VTAVSVIIAHIDQFDNSAMTYFFLILLLFYYFWNKEH